MDQNIDNIDVLIGKSVSGNASEEEQVQLNEWVKSSNANEQKWKDALKVWNSSKSRVSEKERLLDKWHVNQVLNNELSDSINRLQRRSNLFKIAAVMAFPIAFALWYILLPGITGRNRVPQICEIISPKGHISKCVLPDGTEVWLNTSSSIYYNVANFNDVSREINLEGEAYFRVVKNLRLPFIIVTAHVDVKVTGTSFNVKTYQNDNIFETVLEEGSVELMIKGGNAKAVYLTSGDHIIYEPSSGKFTSEKVEAKIFTAWRNGEILFRDATLKDLIRELERIYDLQFQLVDSELGEYRFRGMFSYNNNLIEALEKIKYTSGIDYYIENKNVTLFKIRK